MTNTKSRYSYLVAVLVWLPDTGVNATTTIDVNTEFRITKTTVPVLMERVKEEWAKDKHLTQLPKSAVIKIIAFSRYEEE